MKLKQKSAWLRLPLLAVASLLLLSPAGLQAQSGNAAWGTVPSPNGGFGPNELFDLDVLSANDIWAVGNFGDFVSPSPQVQHWDGVSWRVVPVPAGIEGDLIGVAAVAANDVWFVGGEANDGHALIFHWDGNNITQASNPNPGLFNRLYAVTAVSANDVWAVGEYASGGVSKTLIEHWNGSSWTQVASPTSTNEYTRFLGVSAISATDIWAVGEAGSNTFAAHWDGVSWQTVATPKISFSSFSDVSTTSTGVVWAVGDSSKGTLTERWTGTAWEVVASPSPGTFGNALNGVVVLSANDVYAVGEYTLLGNYKTLALHWNGTAWTQVTSPSPDPSYNVLNGVDADSQSNIWAVGRGDGTLTTRWTGASFDTVPGANSGTGANVLASISAVGPNDIWAVGNAQSDTLAMHWDGATWTIVPTPTYTLDSQLEGVAAVAANDVWAVGFQSLPSSLDSTNIILHWNGSTWTEVPSPNPGGRNLDKLYDVAFVTANNGYAVGEYKDNTGKEVATILHWDGAVWTVVPNSCSPLFGITIISANDIWAVGYSSCHYDGTTWTPVAIPPSGGADTLRDVSARATDDIFAVGTSTFCDGFGCHSTSYAIHWNGTQWTLAGKPPGVSLGGVLTLGPNKALAVGTFSVGTLIARWNGKSWKTVPSPDPVRGGELNEVISVRGNPTKLWAVGAFFNENTEWRTLILNSPSDTQGTVTGSTGVSDAIVSWFGPSTGSATTDIFGNYAAAGLLAGTYTFAATANGCTPTIATVEVIAGKTVKKNLDINCP